MAEPAECYPPWCLGLPLSVTGALEAQLGCSGSVAHLWSYLSERLASDPYAPSFLLVVFRFGLYEASYLFVINA